MKGFLGINVNTNLELHPEQMKWLQEVVQPQKDNRGLILLSHHQVFSAFDKEIYPKPAKQLADLLGSGERTVIWFWGHEHRLSLYGENVMNNGLRVFGRCIGHGGMPVDIDQEPNKDSLRNLVVFDKRLRKKIDEKYPVGYNGYVILKLKGAEIAIEYYDDNDNNDLKQERKILEEKWRLENGCLKGVSITDFTSASPKKLTQVQEPENALQQSAAKEPAPTLV